MAAYSYSGDTADNSGVIKKKTNYGQKMILIVSGATVAADAVKVQLKNVDDAYVSHAETEFGAGYHTLELPTGIEFKIDVDNGVNDIVVDAYV